MQVEVKRTIVINEEEIKQQLKDYIYTMHSIIVDTKDIKCSTSRSGELTCIVQQTLDNLSKA